MDSTIINSLIENKKFLDNCELLYGKGNEKYQAKRYKNLYQIHSKTYGEGGVFRKVLGDRQRYSSSVSGS